MLKRTITLMLCAAVAIMSIGTQALADTVQSGTAVYDWNGVSDHAKVWADEWGSFAKTDADGVLTFSASPAGFDGSAMGKSATRFANIETEDNNEETAVVDFKLNVPSTVNGSESTLDKSNYNTILVAYCYKINFEVKQNADNMWLICGNRMIISPNPGRDSWNRFRVAIDYKNMKTTITAFGNDGKKDVSATDAITSTSEKSRVGAMVLSAVTTTRDANSAEIKLKDLNVSRAKTAVISSNIADNAVNVNPGDIELTFNSRPDAAKLTNAISVKNGAGEQMSVAPKVTADGNIAKITFAGLSTMQKYTMTVAGGTDIGECGEMASDYSLTFTTGAETKVYDWNNISDHTAGWADSWGRVALTEENGELTFSNSGPVAYSGNNCTKQFASIETSAGDGAAVIDFYAKIPSEVNGNPTTIKDSVFAVYCGKAVFYLTIANYKMGIKYYDTQGFVDNAVVSPNFAYDNWNRFRLTLDYDNMKMTMTAYGSNGQSDVTSTVNLPASDRDSWVSQMQVTLVSTTGEANSAELKLKDINISRIKSNVVSANIENGAVDVDASDIELSFNGLVDADKVKNALKLTGADGSETAADVSAVLMSDKKTVKIGIEGLKHKSKYTLALPKGTDVGEYGSLGEGYSVTFTTKASNYERKVYNWSAVSDHTKGWADYWGSVSLTEESGELTFRNSGPVASSGGNCTKQYTPIESAEADGVAVIDFSAYIPSEVNGAATTIKDNVMAIYCGKAAFYLTASNYKMGIKYYDTQNYMDDAVVSPNPIYDNWNRFRIAVDYINMKMRLTAFGNNGQEDVTKVYSIPTSDRTAYVSTMQVTLASTTGAANTAELKLKNINILRDGNGIISSSIENNAGAVNADSITLEFKSAVDLQKLSEVLCIKNDKGETVDCIKEISLSEDGTAAVVKTEKLAAGAVYTLVLPSGANLGDFSLTTEENATEFTVAYSDLKVYDFAIEDSSASAFILNNAEAERNYVLIVAAYNADGTLAGLNIDKQGTLRSGESKTVSASVNVPKAAYCKAFVWDAPENGKPYINSVSTK